MTFSKYQIFKNEEACNYDFNNLLYDVGSLKYAERVSLYTVVIYYSDGLVNFSCLSANCENYKNVSNFRRLEK